MTPIQKAKEILDAFLEYSDEIISLKQQLAAVRPFVWTDQLVDEYSIQRLDGNFLTMQEFKQSKSEGQPAQE